MYPSLSGGTYGAFGSYGALALYGSLVPYGSLNLTEASPPQSFAEPVSIADAQAFLQLPPRNPPDPAEEYILSYLISAARLEAEIQQNRDLVIKQWDLSFDTWPGYQVIETRGPLRSVDLFQYRSSDGVIHPMVADVDYVADLNKSPGVITPPRYGMTWPVFTPWPSSAIFIRFTSGMAPNSAWWQETGGIVKAGMVRLISDWYNRRLPVAKGSGSMSDYVGFLSYGAVPRAR